MGLSNAERQARWRAKRDAEIKRLRKAAAAVAKPVVDVVPLQEQRYAVRRLLKPREKK
jgi:hypothetical protein